MVIVATFFPGRDHTITRRISMLVHSLKRAMRIAGVTALTTLAVVSLCLAQEYSFDGKKYEQIDSKWYKHLTRGGISALRIAPSDTGVIYAGTYGGGVFAYTDEMLERE
jgi:hypothetical protein